LFHRGPFTTERVGQTSVRPRPAVLILHGIDGPTERYREAASLVARSCFPTFLVHYFDGVPETARSFREIGNNMALWVEAVSSAISTVREQSDVDPSGVALLGFSFGGAVALAMAQKGHPVRAVTVLSGFMPPAFDLTRHLVPTLILHGELDRVIPVRKAFELSSALSTRAVPHECWTYAGQGHWLNGEAHADAVRRVTGFFRRHLRPM